MGEKDGQQMDDNRPQTETYRFFLKCRACKKPWAVDVVVPSISPYENLKPVDNAYLDANREARKACPFCGNDGVGLHKIMGRVEKAYPWEKANRQRLVEDGHASPCDARCTGATGPTCNCVCGGENHGSHAVRSVIFKAGTVPTNAPVISLTPKEDQNGNA